MNLTLTLSQPNADDDDLAVLTRQMIRDFQQDTDIQAEALTGERLPGSRSIDPEIIGKIMLTLVSSGGIVAMLIEVLKSYLSRDASLEFELKKADGASVKINATNMKPSQMEQTLKQLQNFLDTDEA